MSFPASDYLLWLHPNGKAQAGAAFGQGGAAQYSYYEIDAGKTYSDLSGLPGLGLHVVVTEAYNTLTSLLISVYHGAAQNPGTIIIGSRYFALADLTLGAHYFIPFYAAPILRYLCAIGTPAGGSATTGKMCMWIGPGPDGAK